MNKPKTLTPKQIAMLRRFMLIVSAELAQMANSPKLPDQWGELGCTSYTIDAMAAIYDLMVADKLLPETRAGK